MFHDKLSLTQKRKKKKVKLKNYPKLSTTLNYIITPLPFPSSPKSKYFIIFMWKPHLPLTSHRRWIWKWIRLWIRCPTRYRRTETSKSPPLWLWISISSILPPLISSAALSSELRGGSASATRCPGSDRSSGATVRCSPTKKIPWTSKTSSTLPSPISLSSSETPPRFRRRSTTAVSMLLVAPASPES